MIVLIVFKHLTATNYLSGGRKYSKCGRLGRKKTKILIFDYFLDFECLKMLGTADYDSNNGSTRADNHQLPV